MRAPDGSYTLWDLWIDVGPYNFQKEELTSDTYHTPSQAEGGYSQFTS
jgi:hypothetical protein